MTKYEDGSVMYEPYETISIKEWFVSLFILIGILFLIVIIYEIMWVIISSNGSSLSMTNGSV